MTPLTQQLEDKKKELILWGNGLDLDGKKLDRNGHFKNPYFGMIAQAEIAILEQAITEIKNKKVYCELCNGEDEASICKWCYQNLRDKVVPIPSAKFWREKSIRLNKELQKQRQEEIKFLEELTWVIVTPNLKKLVYNRIEQLNQPKTEE